MKHLKRKILLSACAVALSMDVMADDVGYAMRVTLTNGRIENYLLADRPTVTFGKDSTCIQTIAIYTAYVTSLIKSYTFVDIATGMEEVASEELSDDFYFKFTDGANIQVRGISANAPIRVYSLNGQLQSPEVNRLPDGANISLGLLPTGTYIINIDNKKSIKVQKR